MAHEIWDFNDFRKAVLEEIEFTLPASRRFNKCQMEHDIFPAYFPPFHRVAMAIKYFLSINVNTRDVHTYIYLIKNKYFTEFCA